MRFSAFIKLFIISLSVVFWVSCKNSTGKDTNNPSITTPPSELNNTIKQDEFNGDDIEKELPNGDKFTINTIKEITDTPTVASEKIYQTKIDESGDGFFVVDGESIEGTFTKDGKSYNIGTFKDGQRITESQGIQNEGKILIPPLSESYSISLPRARVTSSDIKPNVSILFVYNKDFWDWCGNDMTIVDNKLNAIIAYTNTAFSRSSINATVSIAGREKITLADDRNLQEIALVNAQKSLEEPNSDLSNFRDLYSADIVFILRKEPIHQGFEDQGRAYFSILKNETSLYQNINHAIGIQDIVMGDLGMSLFSHELGHVFGCAHDDKTRLSQNSTLEKNYNLYANGYWLEDLHFDNSYFTTLMGYGNPIQNYSNPNIDYEGVSTGIAGDSYDAADCARFINFSAPLIADFRGTIPNTPPIADAGSDISANEGESVTLDGSGSSDSDGSIISYEWSEGNTILSNNSSFNKLDFSVGTHTLTLTITDDDGATASDSITVTINAVIIPNQSPIADAGSDISANEGESVTLDGSGSSDSDGSIISYEWSEGNTILSNNSSFNKLDFSVGTHTLTLTITDDDGATASDSITVTINTVITPNQLPIADAGSDISANEGESVTLDGSASSDSEGMISYLWSQTSGTTVTLNNLTTATPFFITPSVDIIDSVLEFKLVVTDSDGATSEDLVSVMVKNIDNQMDTLLYSDCSNAVGCVPTKTITLSTGVFLPGASMNSIVTDELKNIGHNSLTIYGVKYQGSDEISIYGVEECNNIVLDINESTSKCSPSFSYTPTLVGLHTGIITFKYNDGIDKNITIPITLNIIAKALKINSLDKGFVLNQPPSNGMAGSQFLDYYSYMFESNTSDISLHLTGYDVDVDSEICVYLNDTKLECLPTTIDNEYGQPLEIGIPYSMQKEGNNSVEIRQSNAGDLWGVKDIGIFFKNKI